MRNLPTSHVGTTPSVNGWMISLYVPSSDTEQHVAMLVPHAPDDVKTPTDDVPNTTRVPLFHPVMFGIDVDDLHAIEEATYELDRILSPRDL